MAWGKNGTPLTLGSSSDDIDITDMTATNFKLFLTHTIATGVNSHQVTFDNDGGAKYAYRNSWDGSGDSTLVNRNNVPQWDGNNGTSVPQFVVSYLCNISGEEVLGMYWGVDQSTAGAGTAPHRRETVYKFTDTTQITRIDLNNSGAGSFDTLSNLSALGSDLTPAGATVQDGAVFEETDTNKHYLLDDGTWTEL